MKCTQVQPAGTSWTDVRFQLLNGKPATVEGWFRKVTAQNYVSSPEFFRLSNHFGTRIWTVSQYSTGNNLEIRYGTDAGEVYAYTPDANGYVHWAWTHDGNQTSKFFINGVDTRTWSGSSYALGSQVESWTVYIAGTGAQTYPSIEFYIDEFRFWNGKLLYPCLLYTSPSPRD